MATSTPSSMNLLGTHSPSFQRLAHACAHGPSGQRWGHRTLPTLLPAPARLSWNTLGCRKPFMSTAGLLTFKPEFQHSGTRKWAKGICRGKAPLGYSCRLALASCCHFPGLRCAFFVEKVNTTTENSSKEPQTGQNEVKTRCLDNLREKETETAACRHSWALMCAGGCCEHFHELPYLNFQTLL